MGGDAILDQSEVDALLNAVADGGGGGSAPAPQASMPSMAAAPSAASPMTHSFGGSGGGGSITTPKVKVSLHDFKRPERVSQEQSRALNQIHEVFARNFQVSISGFLRTIIDVKLVAVEQLTYSEFIMMLQTPTSIWKLSAEPLDGNALMEMSPSITFPIIDKMLGGKISPTYPDRSLTDIELRIIRQITNRGIEFLKETWSTFKEIDFKILEHESNPQIMQIVPPNEAVVLISFEVTMGEANGMLNLCIPYLMLEPIIGQLTTHNYFGISKNDVDPEQYNRMRESLNDVVLNVRTVLAETTMTLEQLLHLKVGDILSTSKLHNGEAMIFIEGKPKFRARPGEFRHHKALRITRQAIPGEHI